MKIKGAMTVLRKECEFLGLSMEELLTFIQRNPYAQNDATIDAYKIYTAELVTEGK
tara:strand:- start:6682 stop:6849 length:168 start_codon:yes stop_codon:yes gene_type:complete